MNQTKHHLFLLLVLLLAACSTKQNKEVQYDSTAYQNVTLIDGTGSPSQMNMTILVKDGKIVEIGKWDEIKSSAKTEIIDVKGKWVIPGLIDTHAHSTVLPLDSNLAVIEKYDEEATFEALKTMLAFGITTLRNPAAPSNDAISLRQLVQNGEVIGPSIYTAGLALNRTKALFGPFAATTTEKEIRNEIRNQVAQGVDFIKVYGSLKPNEIKIAIDETHKLGKKVIGHLQNTSWTEAANMGIDFITHAAPWNEEYLPKKVQNNYKPSLKGRIFWLENVDYSDAPIQDMLTSLLKNKVSVDPTLIAFHTKFWGDDSLYTQSNYLQLAPLLCTSIWKKTTFTSDWTQEDYSRAKKQWPKLLALTKLLFDKGIMLTAGSDFPNPWIVPGISLHQELILLEEAGIPKSYIIKIATLNGAKALGIEHKTGSIEIGKEADLVFLNANPLDHLENTQRIAFVLKDGKRYNPTELNTHIKVSIE